MLYLLEKLESAINASYLIWKFEPSGPIGDQSPSPAEITFKRKIEADNNEPGDQEINRAMEFIGKFFAFRSLRDWKEELREICMYSLRDSTPLEWGVWIDSMTIYQMCKELVATALSLWRRRGECHPFRN